jgi:hypothetical protein
MAKVLDPLHSGEARGRLGGIVYNTARGNKYVKQFTSPTKRRTAAQMNVRAALSTCSRAWQLLTGAQRTAWAAWAAAHPRIDWTGSSVSWTGSNAYLALNSLLVKHGLAAAAAPPAVVGPASPAVFAAGDGVGSSVVTWTAYAGTGVTVELYYLAPHSPGAVAKIEKATYSMTMLGETATATVTGLPVGLATIFGRAFNEADGQVSPWVQDDATIT